MKRCGTAAWSAVVFCVSIPALAQTSPVAAPRASPAAAPQASAPSLPADAAPVAPPDVAAPPPSPPAAPTGSPPDAGPGSGPPLPLPGAANAPLDAPPAGDDEMTFRATDMDSFAQRSAKESGVSGTSLRAKYSINIFGDVGGGGVTASSGSFPGRTSFGINNFALLFTGDLEKSFKFVAELSVEPDEDNHIGIDAERLSIRWTGRSGIYVEAGKTHLDMGYWNNAYHHGSWLQTPIARPRAVRFEDAGGILPTHAVGLSAGWQADLGTARFFRGSLGVANGRGFQADDIQYKFDANPAKQIDAALELKGLGLRDLRFGVSGVYNSIAPSAQRSNPEGLKEYIGAVDIAYPGADVLFIAEAYAVDHVGAATTWQTYDAFVIVGYRLGDVTPYVQLERVTGKGGLDPFYVIDPSHPITPNLVGMNDLDVAEAIVGARWDASAWCAIKAEYRLARFYDQGNLTTHTGYAAWQWGL